MGNKTGRSGKTSGLSSLTTEHAPGAGARDISTRTAYLAVAACALLPFAHLLPSLATRYIGHHLTDMKLTYRHWIRFTMRAVWSGEIPLWNPYIFCGQPYMPSTHGTLWYPPNWLYLFALPQPLSINLCVLTQAVLMGIFTVYYARVRGISNTGALLAGAVTSMGSTITCRSFVGHFTILCTTPWIPLMFAFQERLFAGRTRYIIPFALAGAAMVMGGHLQHTYYYGLILAAALVLYGVTQTPRQGRVRWFLQQVKWQGLAGIVTALLVAVEILPAIDIARNSLRGGGGNLEWLRHFAMPPENLVTAIAPRFWGRGVEYWGRWEWWEACFYIGIVPLALCIASIALRLRTRQVDHLTLLFPFLIVLSVAGFIPVLNQALRLIPGWLMFRGHNRVLNFALVFAAILAAHGFDLLRVSSPRMQSYTKRALAAIGALALLLLPFCSESSWTRMFQSEWLKRELFNANPLTDLALLARVIKTSATSAVTAAVLAGAALLFMMGRFQKQTPRLLLAVTILDLMIFALPKPSFTEPHVNIVPSETAQFFNSVSADARSGVPRMINEGTSHEIPSIEGDDIVVTRYYNTFLCAYLRQKTIVPNFTFFLQGEHPLLDAMNLRYLGMPPDSNAARSGVYKPLGLKDNLLIGERTTALPRAYVVGSAKWIPEEEPQILRELSSPEADLHEQVLLCGTSPPAPPASTVVEAVPAKATYVSLHRTEVTAPEAGWLVLADGYYPFWNAYVNDKRVPVYRANGTFRAVAVSKGDAVVFKYENTLFRVGAVVSLIGLMGTLVTGLVLLKRRQLHAA